MRHLVDMAQNCATGWQRRTEILHAGLIIAHRVGDIGRIPVVPALGVICAVGSYCSNVLVVWKTFWTASAVTVADTAACSTHCQGKERDSEAGTWVGAGLCLIPAKNSNFCEK